MGWGNPFKKTYNAAKSAAKGTTNAARSAYSGAKNGATQAANGAKAAYTATTKGLSNAGSAVTSKTKTGLNSALGGTKRLWWSTARRTQDGLDKTLDGAKGIGGVTVRGVGSGIDLIRGKNEGNRPMPNQGPTRSLPVPHLARRFAPRWVFDSCEGYMPDDPMLFIANSRLRWHESLGRDKCYNKQTRRWPTTNSHDRLLYYSVPVEIINSFGLNPDGTNKRPRDEHRGSYKNLFLETLGNRRGFKDPNGRAPTFWFAKRISARLIEIQYWIFFGYNDGLTAQNHQGDWEHVTLLIEDESRLMGAYFAGHGAAPSLIRPPFLWLGPDGRVQVFCARGSHASYPHPGHHLHHQVIPDQVDGKGVHLDTRLKLLPLDEQPWKDYAGAWGEVGEFSDTTGPLGPYLKRGSK